MSEMKRTPGPWAWKDVAGAGLEIYGPVHLAEGVVLPKGVPPERINICGLTHPQTIQIAYERWVQFAPEGWDEMQKANAALIAAAPELYEALEEAREAVDLLIDIAWCEEGLKTSEKREYRELVAKCRAVLQKARGEQ